MAFCCEICQGITSLRSVILGHSRHASAGPDTALAGSHQSPFIIMAMAENRKDNTGLPQDGRRTEYIGAKVTVEQKRHIRQLAEKCGMTVSDYLLARAFGYKPKERLTERQTAVMETLAGCRSDLVNYTSALRGMNPEKRRQMFGSYPFMLGWLKELGKLAERITGVLDRVRMDNHLPEGTRNIDYQEEEP